MNDHVLKIYTSNNILSLKIEGDLTNAPKLEQKIKDFFSVKRQEFQKGYSELDHVLIAIEASELLNPQSLIFSNLHSYGNLKYNLSNINTNSTLTRGRSNSF